MAIIPVIKILFYLELREDRIALPRILWEDCFVETVTNGGVGRRSTIFGLELVLVQSREIVCLYWFGTRLTSDERLTVALACLFVADIIPRTANVTVAI